MLQAATKRKVSSLRVDETVRIRFGGSLHRAQIIEDRGPIGVNGGRLLRIQLLGTKYEPKQPFEVPADDILSAPIARRRATTRPSSTLTGAVRINGTKR